MKSLSRPPLLLYSYLATEMLAPFFASFLVMNGVFFLVKLIPFLNFSLELGIGAADFIRLFSYMLPNMLLYTIPMASMMGVIICFSRLSNDTEILALKASGISIYRLLPPVFAVAGIIAMATGYVSIQLISKSDGAMKQLTYQLLKEKIDKGIKEYQFTEALGDLVIHVGEIDRETGEWKKVWVSDMRGQESPAITMASTGRMVSDIKKMSVTILLRNGSLHRPDGGDAQIVKFSKYVINIPLQLPTRSQSKQRSTLDMSGLLAASQEYGLDNEKGRDMLVEYHKRLVLPVGCLILSILGLPLGLLAGPGKKTVGIPIGLGIFIVYYIAFTTVKTLAEDGVAPALLLMWLPNTFFIVAAIYSVRRVAHELPILPEQLQGLLNHIYAITLNPLITKLRKFISIIKKTLSEKISTHSDTINSSDISTTIRADDHNKEFHLPECDQYTSTHNTIEFENPQAASVAGFLPCNFCRTLLEEKKTKSPSI